MKSTGMKIYSCCINIENDLRKEIDSSSVKSETCPFCGKESKYIDSEEISNLIRKVLDYLVPSENGAIDLQSLFCKDIRIFCNESIDRLKYYLNDSNCDFNIKYDYNEEIRQVIEDWDSFKKEVKTVRRYTIFDRYLDEKGWDALLKDDNLIFDLSPTTSLYRSRIHDKLVEKAYDSSEMLPPNPNYGDGRAHSRGIPCIYLSREPDTTLYETRVSKLDNVTIAEININSKKRIFDLASSIRCFLNSKSDVSTTLRRNLLLTKISEELSKPIHRHDSPIEYIPTQIICEYIIYLNEVDGIQYFSSMKNKGTNIALFKFNSTDINMKNIDLFSVDDVMISYDKKS